MRILIILTALAVSAGAARAQATDADAYCGWVGNVGKSTAALLDSPQLYLNYGFINGDDSATGSATAGGPFQRLTIGARYSISQLYQGIMTHSRANADCGRYRAASELNAFLESSKFLESREALAAKVKVLSEALPHAKQILEASKIAAEHGYQTVEQLNATQLRVDAMNEQLSTAREQLEIAMQRPAPPKKSIPSLQKVREAAERDVERREGSIRRSQGWDLVLRGGYDRIFGVRDSVPVFGIVSVMVNPAWLWQHHYDHEALEQRTLYARLDPVGADQRAEQVLRQYEVMSRGETQRLQETTVLVADLEKQMKAIEGMPGPHAESFRNYLWFDLIRLRAEVAYLQAHLRDLATYRGDRT